MTAALSGATLSLPTFAASITGSQAAMSAILSAGLDEAHAYGDVAASHARCLP